METTPIYFRPIPEWKGRRKAVSCKTNSELYRAVTLLPAPTKAEDIKKIFNLEPGEYSDRATQQIAYSVDGDGESAGTRKTYNNAMKENSKDLKELQESGWLPPSELWFIEKKETKSTKATKVKNAEARHGKSIDEILAEYEEMKK